MLHRQKLGFDGLRVSISGAGNVAQYAAEKAIELGARVVTLSDSEGSLIVEPGLRLEQLRELMEWKNVQRGRLSAFAERCRLPFAAGRRPWHVPADVALPCATQNELDAEDARRLVEQGVKCVAEGANMPCTLEAVDVFHAAGTLYAPGKASNAGGVATSGLEMTQNAMRLSWLHGEVDERLHAIMKDIHDNCVRNGTRADGSVDYVVGANIAGFIKVADAMRDQGVV